MLDGQHPEKRGNAKSTDSTSQVRDVKTLENQQSFQVVKRIAVQNGSKYFSRKINLA
jgi:hypothetical protein